MPIGVGVRDFRVMSRQAKGKSNGDRGKGTYERKRKCDGLGVGQVRRVQDGSV